MQAKMLQILTFLYSASCNKNSTFTRARIIVVAGVLFFFFFYGCQTTIKWRSAFYFVVGALKIVNKGSSPCNLFNFNFCVV